VRDGRPTTTIDHQSTARLRDIWEYRHLLYHFAWRDIKLRYNHTVVGSAWAILQPLSIMLVLSWFASLLHVNTGRVPYPLFALAGLVPWTYFTHAFTQTTHSLVAHSGIIGKVYFPRLIVPIAATVGGAMDFLMAGLLLPLFMFHYGVRPTAALATLPLFVLMALATALAMGLWLAVLNVRFRDVVNAMPLITQLLFFTTPIVFRADLLAEPWKTLAGFNPMVGVVDGFRWALLGAAVPPPTRSLFVSLAVIATMLVLGIRYFQSQEPLLAEVL